MLYDSTEYVRRNTPYACLYCTSHGLLLLFFLSEFLQMVLTRLCIPQFVRARFAPCYQYACVGLKQRQFVSKKIIFHTLFDCNFSPMGHIGWMRSAGAVVGRHTAGFKSKQPLV